ncbi:HEAT repeat domain-containing protein [Bacteroides ihuae]|uniref:HEAT repeat domain-containing protein n=1 Tax=Bacteroides ihuae TaxID=1852362 RepID=UPI0008DAA0B2|nr:HEAT repeat domain-containing protein [Bacteroides ihuae]
MKKSLFILLFLVQAVGLWAAPEVIKPGIQSKTSFAIIIDSQSYEKAKEAVNAYRAVIEKDGLGTYIIVDNWQSPQDIRKILLDLYQQKKSPLEGAVFVGDIPIPMIRDGQFLTSAFKMDQRMNWKRSSIASDRYYDDFDLKFDFLKRDEDKPLYFYFSLTPESRQYLRSDIYTARIKPVIIDGKDKYELLNKYLAKVVKERSEENPINNLSMMRGHGYNSQAREAWAGEQLALREQFPDLFKTGNLVRFSDFDSEWPAKDYYLREVQRPDLDIVLFHHHGASDTQYLNGYKEGSDPNTSIDNIRQYLRGKVREAKRKKKDVEETMQNYMKMFGVPREWMTDAFDSANILKDSLLDASLDVHLEDLHAIKPNARFVMFDACYNGSFYEDDYIAGAYIFSDGKTIVTQGNTVNAIQDKWPDEFIGLLNCGIRIGQWHKHVQFLETHLIGDPTYRFKNLADPSLNINEAITLHAKDNKLWQKLQKSPIVDVRCIALRKLYENHDASLPKTLKETFSNSGAGVERMEAMRLLFLLNAPELHDVLKLAVNDSYELVRRFAVEYISETGSDDLIPALVNTLLNDWTSTRVQYKAMDGVKLMNTAKMAEEIKKQAAESSQWVNKDAIVKELLDKVERLEAGNKKDLDAVMDTATSKKEKMFAIRSYRNNPIHEIAPQLCTFSLDPNRDAELRIAAIEALSWFTHSWQQDVIIAACDKLIATDSNKDIVRQAQKTKARLLPE